MNGDPVSDPEYLNLDGCARLLHLRPGQLRRSARDRQFPSPAGTERGASWRKDDILRWAAATSPDLAAQVPLRYWPDAAEPAEYLGASANDDAVVMTWQTESGTIAVVWNFVDPIMVHLPDYVRRVNGATIVVNVDPDFGIDGPGVRAINTAIPDKEQYSLRWSDMSRVLGQPMPYWPLALRIPELICAWKPGAAPITAPTQPDIDTTALLRMAATLESEHPAHRTLLNLARVAHHRTTASALQDLKILHESITRDSGPDVPTAIAAIPLPAPEASREDLDSTTRRAGWLEVLGRSDTLSMQCVREVRAWDGGKDFPFSNPEEVDPTAPPGSEWAQRLKPIQRTAAFELIDYQGEGETLTDPATDAPAVRKTNGQLVAAIPQRLPATRPLAALILARDLIWVRTQDGTLYPAPKHPSFGLSWGYGGSGPAALAALIDCLLDDINAAAPALPYDAPEGLQILTQTKWPAGTTLTREQLETARHGHPLPPD